MSHTHVRIEEDDDWVLFCNKPSVEGYGHEIEAGAYKGGYNPIANKTWLEPAPVKTEGLIPIPDPASVQILEFIEAFFTQEAKRKYARYDVLYRAGIFLYGAPGTGKTYTIHRVIEEAAAKNYIILRDPDPRHIKMFVDHIRSATKNPTREILVIWEEFDDLLARGLEKSILELLDGTQTMEHIIYLATTNYVEKIPKRIKARPSRFNLVIEAKAPNAEQRRVYFQHKLHKDDLEQWLEPMVEASEGFVLDFAKELILGILIYNRDLKSEVTRLREMAELPALVDAEATEDPDSD